MSSPASQPVQASSAAASVAATHPPAVDEATAASDPSTPTSTLLRLAEKHPDEVLRNPVFDLAMVADPRFLRGLSDRALAAMVSCDAADPVFLRRVAALLAPPGLARAANGPPQPPRYPVMPSASFALAVRADCPRDVLELLAAFPQDRGLPRGRAELAAARLASMDGAKPVWRPAVTEDIARACFVPTGMALPPDVTFAFARHGHFDPEGPIAHALAILTARRLRMGLVATVAGSPSHSSWLAAAARAELRGGEGCMCSHSVWREVEWCWRGIEPLAAKHARSADMLAVEAASWSETRRGAIRLRKRWDAGKIVDGQGKPWKFADTHRELSLEQAEGLALELPEAAFCTSAYMLLLCSPRCPVDLLRERSRHSDWLVRLCVAFNRSTPHAERQALLADRNWLVRCAAQEAATIGAGSPTLPP